MTCIFRRCPGTDVAHTFLVLYSVYTRIVLYHPSAALPSLAGVGTRLAGVGTRLAGVGTRLAGVGTRLAVLSFQSQTNCMKNIQFYRKLCNPWGRSSWEVRDPAGPAKCVMLTDHVWGGPPHMVAHLISGESNIY
jgi:hypothetical protein